MRILLNVHFEIWPQLGINEYIYQHKKSYSTIMSPLILILVFTVLDQEKGTGGLGWSTRNQDYGGSHRQILSFQVITLWTLIGITFNLVIKLSNFHQITMIHSLFLPQSWAVLGSSKPHWGSVRLTIASRGENMARNKCYI